MYMVFQINLPRKVQTERANPLTRIHFYASARLTSQFYHAARSSLLNAYARLTGLVSRLQEVRINVKNVVSVAELCHGTTMRRKVG